MQNQIENWKESEEYQALGNRQGAFDIWLDNWGMDVFSYYSNDISDAIMDFEQEYIGHYSSKLEFGKELADETILIDAPDNIRYCFDYEQFTYDIFLGDYWFRDGHVFRSL